MSKSDPAATLAATLASTIDELELARAKFNSANEKLSRFQAWCDYNHALTIIRTLDPQIPNLEGYAEFKAANESLTAAELAAKVALVEYRKNKTTVTAQ